jgi:hypothetical protein
MLAKYVRFSAVLVCLVFLALPAYADVVGTWDITGTLVHKAKVKGVKLPKDTVPVSDTFIFSDTGDFTMTGLTGTWAPVKKKYVVTIDNTLLETFWTTKTRELFLAEGINVTLDNLTITRNIFTGKENKDGTSKGKWKLNFTANVTYNAQVFFMKVTTTTTAIGTKVALNALSPESDQSEELSDENIAGVIAEELCDQIKEAIMGY